MSILSQPELAGVGGDGPFDTEVVVELQAVDGNAVGRGVAAISFYIHELFV